MCFVYRDNTIIAGEVLLQWAVHDDKPVLNGCDSGDKWYSYFDKMKIFFVILLFFNFFVIEGVI